MNLSLSVLCLSFLLCGNLFLNWLIYFLELSCSFLEHQLCAKRDFWVDWTGKCKSINGALTFWKNVLFRKTAQVIGQNSLFQQVAGFLYYMYCQKESLISLNCDRGGHQMMLSETYFGSLLPSLPSHAQIPGFAWSWEDSRIKKSSELNINYFKRVEVLPPGFNTQNVKLRKALWFFTILWSSHLSSFFYM